METHEFCEKRKLRFNKILTLGNQLKFCAVYCLNALKKCPFNGLNFVITSSTLSIQNIEDTEICYKYLRVQDVFYGYGPTMPSLRMLVNFYHKFSWNAKLYCAYRMIILRILERNFS